MDIGRHKEEPPDEEESEDGEILQTEREEGSLLAESDSSQVSKCEQGQVDLRLSHENKHDKNPEEQRGKIPMQIENVLKQGTKSELGQTGQGSRPDYGNMYILPLPEENVTTQEIKYELGQVEHMFGFGANKNESKAKVLVIDGKHETLEQNIPESPITPDFADCNSTMGTPLMSPSKCSQKVPVFFIGGGKPIFTQSQSDKEDQTPSDIEKQIPLPLKMGNLSYIGNTENAELIIHSNIVIKKTDNIIVEVDDRMEQPLGPSEVVKTAEEGDAVLSQSTETLINNTKSLASDESQINVVQPAVTLAQRVANNAFESQESSVSSASESNFREFLVPSTSSERKYRRTSRIERVTIRDSEKGKAEKRKRLSPDVQEVKRSQRELRTKKNFMRGFFGQRKIKSS
ncbi:hypothetical protein JTB14_027426 [Gonioctena quinquepunctata]|nr:hypothetical protein JTB14_027426 [Gonioctena quinquepunctata]